MKKALFSLMACMAILVAPAVAQAAQPTAHASTDPATKIISPFAAVTPAEQDPFLPFTIFPPNE